jgi:hypothetical protein
MGFNPGGFADPGGSRTSLASRKELVALQSLLSAVDWLASVPDRRKSIVFVSEGFASTQVDVAFALRDVVSVAARSSVAIYSVDPHGLPTGSRGAIAAAALPDDDPVDGSRFYRTQTLSALSESTGGASVIASNAFDELFERVVADNTVYYLLDITRALSTAKSRGA